MSGAPGYRERSRVEKEAWIQREEQSGEGNLEKGEQQGLNGYLDTGGGAGLRSASGYMGRTRIEKEPWGTEKKEQG